MMEIGILSASALKALVIAVLIVLAKQWADGKFSKPIKNLKNLRKEYGLVTIALIIFWWVLTPSGMPDDLLAVWLIANVGIVPYSLLLGGLTLYLLWRLRITFVIYKN